MRAIPYTRTESQYPTRSFGAHRIQYSTEARNTIAKFKEMVTVSPISSFMMNYVDVASVEDYCVFDSTITFQEIAPDAQPGTDVDINNDVTFLGRFSLPEELLVVTEFTLASLELLSLTVCRLQGIPFDLAVKFAACAVFF